MKETNVRDSADNRAANVNANANQQEAIMALLASMYDQSTYFKAADLQKPRRLKIKNVTEETVGQDAEKKLVVWFTNDEHGLVLNRTNNRTIRGAYGDDVAGWTGRVIELYPTEAEFRGKIGPALRVRTAPKQAGNGQAAELEPAEQPKQAVVQQKSLAEDLNDEVPWA
jgi:hypothetical protein